ncbi:hypothetical protein [Rarobacter faecitabidus]|uniref:hypothetical protein n=1 Tax=Rarobacter faecitabidus TaxID=13243 RepID=UPI00114E86AC|nr:hypothetical protein [Rarobacter faecitabidus]
MTALARIHGTYEYDDDDLTPGRKKEGGFHQNLYDGDGKLRGNARFIPDDDQPEEDYDSDYGDPHYAAQSAAETEAEDRRREQDQQEQAELILKAVVVLAAVAYVKAKPHVQRLWQEKISPTIQSKLDARSLRKTERQARREQKRATVQREPNEMPNRVHESVENPSTLPSNDLAVASQEYRRNMSSSEAQARYLMALVAKAFSDEQLRIVANANIVEDEQIVELEGTLAQLPPTQVAQLIDSLETNPSALTSESFDLAALLAETAEQSPLSAHREPRRSDQ